MDINKCIQKVKEIDSEIEEMHPLLSNLFMKMHSDGIVSCNKTHGNSERGADFVLTQKISFPQDSLKYIGVVAKIGQCTATIIPTVENQIQMCFEFSRFTEHGMQQGNITEVWVIFTDSITQHAQQLINKRFKNFSIRFFDGIQLGRLVHKYLPNQWSALSSETYDFLYENIATIEKVDKKFALLDTSEDNFFIDLEIYETNYRKYSKNKKAIDHRKRQKININEIISREKFILLQGAAGSGKSKFLRRIALDCLHPDFFSEFKIMPLLVPFKQLVDGYKNNINEYISNTIPTIVKEKLPKDVKYLILIDAIDEKDLKTEELCKIFKDLYDQILLIPNSTLITTTRNIDELYENKIINGFTFQCEIAELSLNQILTMMKRACKNISTNQRLFEDLKKSSLFHNMPKNPMVAILLAHIINQNPQELPSNLTELYDKYMDIVVGKWEEKKGNITTQEYAASHHILMEIAKLLMDNNLDLISVGDMENMAKDYIKDRGFLKLNCDTIINKVISKSDIVIVDREKQIFCFKHKSFAEFLVAQRNIKHIIPLEKEKVFNPYWVGMIYFYIGLKKDAGEEITEIMAIQTTSEIERIFKIFKSSEYMLAGYLTQEKIITNAITTIILELSYLYRDIVSRKITSQLSELTQMHLLSFFRYLVINFYSYEMFKEPLRDAMINIHENSNIEEDIKIYALFFIATTLLSLNDPVYDLVLTQYKKAIPLDILNAIGYDFKKMKENKRNMKTQDLVLKRILKGRNISPQEENTIYNIPIKNLKRLK